MWLMVSNKQRTTNNQFNNTQQIKIQYNILCRRKINFIQKKIGKKGKTLKGKGDSKHSGAE